MMIEKIKKVLAACGNVDGYKITEERTEGRELFFIGKELEMNRAKEVHHFKVTVYKDFTENGEQFRGSATVPVHPTMTEAEIREVLADGVFAAGFVRNRYYPLVKPGKPMPPLPQSNFSAAPLDAWLPPLVEALYAADHYEPGRINSAEVFLNKVRTRVVNSEGVDAAREYYRGEVEFITNWKEEAGEEVELYKNLKFAGFDRESLTQTVDRMLMMSREKALAKPLPALKKHTVLLTGEPVREFFRYYYIHSGAQSVYEQISTAKLGEEFQGPETKGDRINMTLDPLMEYSSESTAFDEDGLPLSAVKIFENGVLTRYWGNNQFSFYLGVEPTGNIRNIIIGGGSKSAAEMKAEPYLELAAFSDFQMDPVTGDFGGEIRLGWYYDGKSLIPVTGGSISGNVKEVQEEMYFSRELQRENDFLGPETIQLFNVSVTGSEEK